MSSDKSEHFIDPAVAVRLFSDIEENATVPFAILAQVLADMQQTFYLFAMQHEGREIHERARIPSEVEQRYVLRALIPESGSYLVPALVGNSSSDPSAIESTITVLNSFHSFSQALGNRESSTLRRIVPDSSLRRRILERFRSMIPKSGSGWNLELQYGNREIVICNEQMRLEVGRLLKRVDSDVITQTVTGILSKIDFKAHKLTLLYPPTQRELDCYYDAAIEELLLQNPRELIQVTGEVTLDDDDCPKRITDVEDIREVDLTPFVLSDIRYDDRTLRFRSPIEITPFLDESMQLFCLEYVELGIDVCASTREDLDIALHEELDVLWRNYALETIDNLTPGAQRIRTGLLNTIEEISHAA